MLNCKKCGKEFKIEKGLKSYCSIECRNSREQTDIVKAKKSKAAKLSNKVKNPTKGLFGEKNPNWIPRVESICVYCEKPLTYQVTKPRKYHKECYLKVAGGYRKGSGRGKSGWYKGYWCDSSYELAWIIYNLDHNLPFERNKQKFKYEWNGKEYTYIPDFVQNGFIIEIKGFTTPQVEEKLKSVLNLKVLFKKDLVKEFKYVEKTYGKEFTRLYEN